MWCVMETIVGLDSGQLHHRATIHVTPINIPLEYPCQSHSSPSHPQAREAAGWQFLWLSLSHNFTSYPDWWGHSTSDTSHSFRAAQNRTDVRKIWGVPKKYLWFWRTLIALSIMNYPWMLGVCWNCFGLSFPMSAETLWLPQKLPEKTSPTTRSWELLSI